MAEKEIEAEPKKEEKVHEPITVEPTVTPSPTLDGKEPIPAGDGEVEKFLVATDTEGGD